MKVLLIGAGAVGQVYGYHFLHGGAEVTFYVREKYAAEVRQGFDLYPMNRKKPREAPVRFDGFGVLIDMAEVAARSWDVVVLCLSSTALRKGTWLAELAAGLGDATLVNLTPGIEDRAHLLTLVPESQLVSGMIGISSYPGPLEGETLPTPGMVYWVPPRTKMAFSGSDVRTQPVVAALNAGGLASKQVEDVLIGAAFGGPLLQFLMVALELSGWTFAGLRKNKPIMKLAHQATREAQAVAAARLGRKAPLSMRMMRPGLLRFATRLVPMVAPFDMAKFFKKHFLKVGDQTEFGIETRIRLAKDHDLPSGQMEALLSALKAHRG